MLSGVLLPTGRRFFFPIRGTSPSACVDPPSPAPPRWECMMHSTILAVLGVPDIWSDKPNLPGAVESTGLHETGAE